MAQVLQHCGKLVRSLMMSRPTTPSPMTSAVKSFTSIPVCAQGMLPQSLTFPSLHTARSYCSKNSKGKGKIGCACSRHPWPEEEKKPEPKEKSKDCNFDFKKLEVNPYDTPCECNDPPPAAGCKDVGGPKEVCCRSTRQYGCHCEEEEESCEEEEEEEVVAKACDLDFRKLEVNPYDDPCECHDPPPASSCESLAMKQDVCCRTPQPFGCFCEAYDDPGLLCTKQKAPAQKKQKKECNKKKYGAKCL